MSNADRLDRIEAMLAKILEQMDRQREPVKFVEFQDKVAALTDAYRSGDKGRLKDVQKVINKGKR